MLRCKLWEAFIFKCWIKICQKSGVKRNQRTRPLQIERMPREERILRRKWPIMRDPAGVSIS